MKKILLILSLFFGLVSFAQRGQMKERIKAQKVAFITEKLSLTADEAEKFWPIYNAFETTTDNIRSKDLRDVKQSVRRNPDMSDAEANKVLDKLLKAENNMHKAKVKLISDLKGVIPVKKIIRLKRAEDEFNRELLKKLRDRRKRD
ncbi:hypothetical protein BTO05_04275 [Winogradskyella sp. PC-19]|uniref:sensor of ECF-type sigma factor n=1 Tax=unclassified Winogradskyella TaxID=2615021 RepID=UPI000B55073F|nr:MULTISPECIES: sensor of ECF-type sigma factor [unclassified Winogradskyella]ARV08888.1 hypothetical protein BTO05_04275 [Winogradskyella sp. PC-19]